MRKSNNNEDHREFIRLHRLAFPELWKRYNRTSNKRRYKVHKEKFLAQCKEYRTRNRDKVRAYFRNYWRTNGEKRRVAIKNARAKRPEYYARLHLANCRKRQAKQKNVTVLDCNAKMIALASAKLCHWCESELTPKTRTVDHVIPLARGGAHSPDNLVASCMKCNQRKGALLPSEWLRKLAA